MFQELSLRRPRISGAPFRFAPRCTASGERHVVCFSGAALWRAEDARERACGGAPPTLRQAASQPST